MATDRITAARPLLLVPLVLLTGAALGGATSLAQTFLPDALRPFANSASGWTLLTALIVARARASTGLSAVLGTASFVMLLIGYEVVSELRGFPTDETLFLVVGSIVGPFVGAAAAWLRRDGWHAALGCGVLSGVALGEGIYGLIVISASTGWFYWTVITVAGVGLLVHTVVLRLHSTSVRVVTVGVVLAVGAAFFTAYIGVGEIGVDHPPGDADRSPVASARATDPDTDRT